MQPILVAAVGVVVGWLFGLKAKAKTHAIALQTVASESRAEGRAAGVEHGKMLGREEARVRGLCSPPSLPSHS